MKQIIVPVAVANPMGITDFHDLLASPSLLEFPFTQPSLNWPQ